jgi:hypothetical protein
MGNPMRQLIISVVALVIAGALTMSAAQDTGKLSIYTNTGRAGVFIDGKYLGPVANFGWSLTYKVPAGEHEIRVSDPRYEELVKSVTIAPGRLTKISQKMRALPPAQPPFGMVRTIAADKFTAVYVNGKFVGHTDEFSNPYQRLLLNPGEYMLKLVPSGNGSAHEQRIKVEADQTVVVRAN